MVSRRGCDSHQHEGQRQARKRGLLGPWHGGRGASHPAPLGAEPGPHGPQRPHTQAWGKAASHQASPAKGTYRGQDG